jgi:DNA-binding CsgD family transcriptional regulator
MARLGDRDLQAVLDCLRMTYGTLDLEAFPRQAVAGLLRVVPAPFGSYNEVDRGATRIRYVVEPGDAQVSHLELNASQYRHEQPVLAHYLRTGDGSPHKLSDFLTQQKLHRLGIYNENYRRTGVEYQMAFMLKSLQRQSARTIAIALDRGRGDTDFTERDRHILRALRPHLMTAYANAELVSAVRRTAPAASGAPETRRREFVFLRRSGRHLMSPRASYWLTLYFDDGSAQRDQLPENLQRWVREQADRLGRSDALMAPPQPLIVRREHTRLRIRFIPDSPDDLLVLEEEHTNVDYAAIEQLGLTPREAEVLHWVREGKTNKDIGMILCASPRTVGKHLERVYAKLGVETRTAAAARAPARAGDAHLDGGG